METLRENVVAAAKDQYDEQGFCLVDGIYDERELGEMETFFESFRASGKAAFDAGRDYEQIDPTQELLRAMCPHRHDRRVLDWYLHPRVAHVLEVLLGKLPLAAQSMYYYKPPGSVGQGMHQDDFYLKTRPARCIAAWTVLDDTDEENGCLRVMPGSHRDGLVCPDAEHWEDVEHREGGRINADYLATRTAIPIPMRRGQTLFFGGYLIHGSEANRSATRCRRTFIGHYVDQDTTSLSEYYHPLLDMDGRAVGGPAPTPGGGACEGDQFEGEARPFSRRQG